MILIIKNLINKINPLNEGFCDIFILMSGAVVAQVIPIIISPVLTRIYTPKDFGIYAIFTAIVSYLSISATGRYEMAIMLPKKNDAAALIALLCLIIASIYSVLVLVLIFFINKYFLKYLKEDISDFIYLIPISIICIATSKTFILLHSRLKNFKTITINQISQSSITGFTQIVFNVITSSGGLILGSLSGLIYSSLRISVISIKVELLKFGHFTTKRALKLLYEYRDMPLNSVPEAFLGQGNIFILPIAIAFLYGPKMAGFYALSYRIVMLPGSIITQSFGQVFFRKSSMMYNNKSPITKLIFKSWLLMFVLIFPISFFLYFFSPIVFKYIFGVEWTFSGEIASIMSFYLLITFVFSSTSSSAITLRKQHMSLIFGIVAILYKIILFLCCYYYSIHFLTFITFIVIFDCLQFTIFGLYIMCIAHNVRVQNYTESE